MRVVLPFAAALIAMPLLAQTPPVEDRHAVAPDSNWSITDSDCAIDAGWDGDVAIMVSPHDDHHDLGLYNPRLTGVIDGKVVMLRYGAGDERASATTNEALGHRNRTATSYVADIHDDLFDRIATSGSLQIYRAAATLADLDMAGFGPALAAMRVCEAAKAAPATDALSADAAASAAAAADAAAEAASTAAATKRPRKPR